MNVQVFMLCKCLCCTIWFLSLNNCIELLFTVCHLKQSQFCWCWKQLNWRVSPLQGLLFNRNVVYVVFNLIFHYHFLKAFNIIATGAAQVEREDLDMPLPPNPIHHGQLLEEARENLTDQLRTLGAPLAENTNAMAALTRRVMAMEEKIQSLETELKLMKARHTATTPQLNFTFPHAAAHPPAPLERPPPAAQPAPLPAALPHAIDPGAELDNIAQGVLLDLMTTQTTNALARKLANVYFTKEERIPFNMNGTHGYTRLDPIRVEKLKATFLHLMGAPAENQESLWAIKPSSR